MVPRNRRETCAILQVWQHCYTVYYFSASIIFCDWQSSSNNQTAYPISDTDIRYRYPIPISDIRYRWKVIYVCVGYALREGKKG